MPPQSLVPVHGAYRLARASSPAACLAAASLLHGASRALAALARRLARPHHGALALPPQLEFHAEAGAPEGALYADGVLVALLPGVTRL